MYVYKNEDKQIFVLRLSRSKTTLPILEAYNKNLQYQRRGIGELVLKDQHQLVLKYQQATPLEWAGMPLWLYLKFYEGICNLSQPKVTF